jgi:hypothetical protein
MRMRGNNSKQQLPSAGPEREALRQKGQFWTPAWVAEAMVAYVLADGAKELFDPAVGEGAFFRATKRLGRVRLIGTELDPQALEQARSNGLSVADLAHVEITDFVLRPPRGPFRAIVANPPYIRHHRLPAAVKAQLRLLGRSILGVALDGRAGLHVYFLLRALQLLEKGGRLAFIMPADTCEGVFARPLWNWISSRYRLDAVVTFTGEASPFPTVDTNPVIFFIRNMPPTKAFLWAQCSEAETTALTQWVMSDLHLMSEPAIRVTKRDLAEALQTGLSRPPSELREHEPRLGDFATVLRGIVTGANDFFFLTRTRARELRLPAEFLRPAIGRTRDAVREELTPSDLDALDAKGRPTLLLCLDNRPLHQFPPPVQEYIQYGETLNLPTRPVIAQRRPWYKMEQRAVPPILFAYLGRRNCRFIRNHAGVVPLTCLLCVYPKRPDAEFHDALWRILNHPRTIANLARVGKSYGSGAIKVEPRSLERLPLPVDLVEEADLHGAPKAQQIELIYS